MKTTDFYLGIHRPYWLWDERFAGVPVCVSRNELFKLVNFKRAVTRWVLDSGAFTALLNHGRFLVSAEEYAQQASRAFREIGSMIWASIQDWMCEAFMLAKTGLTLGEHQRRSVQSWVDLTRLAPEVPWLPVLQGQLPSDYVKHLAMYREAGCADVRFGLGSVCRRQSTKEIVAIAEALNPFGLDLHGFGVKTLGLELIGDILASSDSMAWSYAARRDKPLAGCGHASCRNCAVYALRWRDRLLQRLSRSLFMGANP